MEGWGPREAQIVITKWDSLDSSCLNVALDLGLVKPSVALGSPENAPKLCKRCFWRGNWTRNVSHRSTCRVQEPFLPRNNRVIRLHVKTLPGWSPCRDDSSGSLPARVEPSLRRRAVGGSFVHRWIHLDFCSQRTRELKKDV